MDAGQRAGDATRHDDWTRGPAKWAAGGVLGLGALGVGLWSGLTRTPAPHAGQVVVGRGAGLGGDPVGAGPDASAAPGAPAGEGAGSASPGVEAGRVNINTASRAQLDLLPGIGPALADRIVLDREERGPFATLDDLDRVPGIGLRTIERLRDLATAE